MRDDWEKSSRFKKTSLITYYWLVICLFLSPENTVGFRFGQYRDGTSSVGEPYDLAIIPESMKRVVKVKIRNTNTIN
jgi:hypothetical protein